jgi:predicted N-acetyltransferase YhbS
MLKNSPDYLAELDFVAITDGKIVGNIMYAFSTLEDNTGFAHKVITFGPVSVLPSYQGRGIGSALINHTMALAGKLGHKILVIYGDPAYYCRFGFVAGENHGIRTADGWFSPALQAIELVPGSLNDINGNFHEAEVYNVNPLAAEEFESAFEPKEKLETPSQKRFQEMLSLSHP